ncbi:12319_t:CDS:2, partial [Racocetra fulgida]
DYNQNVRFTSVQSEKDHLLILLAKYIDNIVMIQNDCAIKSCKDLLWSLISKLLSAFNCLHSETHILFEGVPEISKVDIKRIYFLYETSKLCFKQVLEQDIYKTKPQITSRCCLRNINNYKEERNILSLLFVSKEQLTEAKIVNVLLELEK